MHELLVDSEVTFRTMIRSADIVEEIAN